MVVAQYNERVLPYDLNAEAAVLGALLIDGDAIRRVSLILSPQDFHRSRNNLCYEACLSLVATGEDIDQVTVARQLQRQGRLEAVGGMAYLAQLIAATPTSVNVEHYAGIVADTASKRRTIDAGNRIAELGFEDEDSADAVIQKAVDVVHGLQGAQANRGFRHIRTDYDHYLQGDAFLDTPSQGNSVATGYPGLDRILNDLQPSDLLVLGARPAMGKTSLALNVARNAAEAGHVVAIASLEMSREQVAMRLLAEASGVGGHRLKSGLFTVAEEEQVIQAIGNLSQLPIYLDDTPAPPITSIRANAQILQLEHGLDLLIVDYLQLARPDRPSRNDNPVQRMTEISREAKAMARTLSIPVLACSQLSRAVEHRNSHRPQLSDLRESGSIEQDADVVMLLYREDAYVSEEEWGRGNPGQPYPHNVAELNVAKHRHGPTGQVRLYFQEEITRFHEIAQASLQAA